MRTFALLLIAVAPLLGATARADDADARKVVDAAMKAHGGAEALAKFKDKAVIMKGKMKIAVMDLDATMEAYIGDKKFKQVIQLNVMGMDINQVVVYDGKEMWIAINGKVAMTIDKKEDLEPLKET